jgi:glyoxylase-like metal-dependent hydrolase (beta-lactamase superfamily II)
MDIKYLECACHSPDHTMIFTKDDDLIYVSVHLSHGNLWFRLYNSIRYIFGYTCRYGHFDEFILDDTNKNKLEKILNG